ncbi:MAG: NAD(P)-dependent alcohol dehydrogenase [Planctomycetota bacterium]
MNSQAQTVSSDVIPNQTMRAMVYDDYGDAGVLRPAEVDIPKRLPGQVFIRVYASSVNPIDDRLRNGEMRGLLPGGFPRVPGYDVAGVVVNAAGDTRLQVGDRVMAFLDHARGGASAEYAVAAIDVTAKIPDSMSFKTAAAIPLAGTTAIQCLRHHGEIECGDRVLINGASGGVGMFAVQIAKADGAHVTAVASAANRDFCLSIGADEFVDYEAYDFTRCDRKWDIILDVAGKASYFDARRVMAKDSRYVTTEPDAKGVMMTLLTWPFSRSGKAMLAKPKAADLRSLIDLWSQGKLQVAIDSQFALEELTAAHRRVQQGVDHGKVVVVVA